jgi:hypothetical protein
MKPSTEEGEQGRQSDPTSIEGDVVFDAVRACSQTHASICISSASLGEEPPPSLTDTMRVLLAPGLGGELDCVGASVWSTPFGGKLGPCMGPGSAEMDAEAEGSAGGASCCWSCWITVYTARGPYALIAAMAEDKALASCKESSPAMGAGAGAVTERGALDEDCVDAVAKAAFVVAGANSQTAARSF